MKPEKELKISCPYFLSPDSLSPYYSSSTIRFHYNSSPLLFVSTTIRLHYYSSPLLFVSTTFRLHYYSSPTIRLHYYSSPLLFVSRQFVSLRFVSLRFVSTTIRLHYYSSPLLFVSITIRLHYYSSPLLFVSTTIRINCNSIIYNLEDVINNAGKNSYGRSFVSKLLIFLSKGPSIQDVRKIFQFLTPPLVRRCSH